MINTIIFDFAGVISNENFLPVLIRECKEKFGIDEDEFKARFMSVEEPFMLGDMTCKDFWQVACEGHDVPFEQFAEVFANAYVINPEMVSLVKDLKKKYHIVMLSDNFDGLAESVKSNAMLEGLFERIFLSNEIRFAKKTPGCFEYVLAQLGKKPGECVFTDDKEANIQPALALGIHGLHFTGVDKFKEDLKALGVSVES